MSDTPVDTISKFFKTAFAEEIPVGEEKTHLQTFFKSADATMLDDTIQLIKDQIKQFKETKVQPVEDSLMGQMELAVEVYDKLKDPNSFTPKRKADDLYNIEKPKNIRLDVKLTASHIYPWTSQPRGFGLTVYGPSYKEGIVGKSLRDTKNDIGFMTKYNENEKSTFILFESDIKRQAAMDAIKADYPDLIMEVSKYRYPIIKINIFITDLNPDWNEVVKEIKDFNLKKYNKNTFDLHKVYKLRTVTHTTLCIRVDPLIRDFISTEGLGRLFYRGRRLEVLDFFQIHKCFDCGIPGHFRCNKGKQRRCLRCSGPHKRQACNSLTACCPACRGPHEAFHISCPSLQKEIMNDMNNIDYVYTNIMWSTYA